MPKRLQVVLNDSEYADIHRAAQARSLTVSQWVRDALAAARHREPATEAGKKMACVRTAARFSFPSGDIDEMLSEIEAGYHVVDAK